MKWIKQGIIFEPTGNIEWMKTHAALPTAHLINDNLYRVYFSSRNSKNIASVGFLEIDVNDPNKILHLNEQPVLSAGEKGLFDDNGVMAHSVIELDDKMYLYYTGWSLAVSIPFRWGIGLAVSNNGGKTFRKHAAGPILDRNPDDPYFVASPTVIKENDVWKMWYISGIKSAMHKDAPFIPYHIKYAESSDGVNWKREGVVSIDFDGPDEMRIGRASVLEENGIYKMWYSYAVEKYRIGYAESKDGINWKRKDDEAGIDVSKSGWDSEMIEYPFVFEHKGKKYMLYNGNNYGKTGFGYATLSNS